MTRLVTLLTLFAVVSGSFAADWPQWRGPNRDGVSTEVGLLKKWPADGPKLVWKMDKAGLGYSSVIIVDGKLYTLGSNDTDELILCLDAAKGDLLWSAKIGPIFTFQGNSWGDGPRGTPAVDGNILVALGGQGDLVAVDITKKGAELWRKNLIKDFDGVMMTIWGYSESPLIDGDLVVCTPGGAKGTLAALKKTTGDVVWRSTKLTHKAPYSSIVPATFGGTRQYIQLSYVDDGKTNGGFVNGIDAKTGDLLWQSPIFKGASDFASPTPIVIAPDKVYTTTGEGTGSSHLFEIKDNTPTDLFKTKKQQKLRNSHGGVVRVGDFIYGHCDTSSWASQSLKTGDLFQDRDTLNCKSGAITAADGMLYLYTDEGDVALVEANPKAFNVVSSFKLPQLSKYPQTRPTSRSSKAWSHPVISGGKLFVRDCELIYCYDIK